MTITLEHHISRNSHRKMPVFSCAIQIRIAWHSGLEAWRRRPKATDDSNNNWPRTPVSAHMKENKKMRQKRPDNISQTIEAVERWDCDVWEYEQRKGTIPNGPAPRCCASAAEQSLVFFVDPRVVGGVALGFFSRVA